MLNLLASRGLFAALIVIAALAVLLCIGFAVMLFLKPIRTQKTVEADAVKRELYRRETELVIKLVKENATGKEREDLLMDLRRNRLVQLFVDEIIRNEKAERGIVDKPNKGAKRPVRRPANAAKPAPEAKPASESAPADKANEAKEEAATAQAVEKPENKKPA
ncbi:MAG: hypothetical protein K2N23_02180, partial [Clostridia bacterium]|nr:hypothetical protein [Clostridia bacterium]